MSAELLYLELKICPANNSGFFIIINKFHFLYTIILKL